VRDARTGLQLAPAWRIVAALIVMVIVGYAAFAVAVFALLALYPVGLDAGDDAHGIAALMLWTVVAGAVALFLAAGVPGYWLTQRRWMLWPAPVLLGGALAVWGTYGVLNQLGWV
jgi:hypothetical protein